MDVQSSTCAARDGATCLSCAHRDGELELDRRRADRDPQVSDSEFSLARTCITGGFPVPVSNAMNSESDKSYYHLLLHLKITKN